MNASFQPSLSIDLRAVADNWRRLNALSAGGAAAVIKADAYGLGMERCAPALAEAGASRFFVATLAEGVRLREVLGAAPWIGVLEGLSEVQPFVKYGLSPVLNTLEQVEGWRDQPDRGLCLHTDTGMNRLGLSADETRAVLTSEQWAAAGEALLMSHLAASEDPQAASNPQQLSAFQSLCTLAGKERTFTPSLLNSSGHFLGPAFLKVGLSRPGLALFGGNPTPTQPDSPMSPVITLSAPLIQVRQVETGTPVGYGGTWVAPRPTRLGVVALGYADGWPRSASDRLQVSVGGYLCPQVGRVSMDTVILDLSDIPPHLAQVGQVVTVIGDGLPPERFADGAGTISYEILTSLSRRAKRVYLTA